MQRWRLVVVALALLLIASSCSGSDESSKSDPDSEKSPSASNSSVNSSPSSGSADGLRAAFAAVGIDIIDEPAGSARGMELWSYQVENMEREIGDGGGFLGVQLDRLAGAPGGMPFSFLLAGWLSAAPTPTAEAAVALMGDQDWTRAHELIYPTAVLTLFVADAIEAGGGDAPDAMATAQLVIFAQGGICSTLAGWVNSVLDFIFESITIETDGEGFFGWLAVVWNAAVDLARGIIEGLIELLSAEIVTAIGAVLSVVGTLSTIASLLKPWSLDVKPSNTQTRFSVGGSGFDETFVATIDTGIDFEWPSMIEDCASVAGLNLPDPSSAEDSAVSWEVVGMPRLGTVTSKQVLVDMDNEARLEWVTGVEESDRGEALAGTVSVSVTVVSKQVEELNSMLTNWIAGQVSVPPFDEVVRGVFSSLTAPIFETLAQLVEVDGNASVTVIHHAKEEEPEILTGADCVVGTWRVNNDDVLALVGQNLAGVAAEVFAQGSVIATFEDDGTVSYSFNGWRIGNTTSTPGAFGGPNLTGFVSTESSGSAQGTWTADETVLSLAVSFSTNVVQRVVSEDIEVDSEIDAAPGFAGLYVISGGGKRYICNGDLLGVEWADGLGVRWVRIS